MPVVAVSHLVCGAIILLLSMPLIRRKVPMNGLYGIRIAAAFESESRWYDINAFGGRKLAAWSSLIFVSGIAGLFVPRAHALVYLPASTLAVVVAVIVPVLQTLRYAERNKG
jgi:uncharacterized membrane protein